MRKINPPKSKAMQLQVFDSFLNIVLFQDDSRGSEMVEMRGKDGGIMPRNIIVAKVIRHNEDNVWSLHRSMAMVTRVIS